MKLREFSLFRNFRSRAGRGRPGHRGQAMLLAVAAMVGLIAMTGFGVDVGRAYYAYEKLQTASQVAALAGASILSNSTAAEAIAAAQTYSAVTGNSNASPNLGPVTMVSGYPKVKCLSSIGIDCGASPANANAIAVSQQAAVPMTFLKVLGISTMSIAATATAAARGGSGSPYNIAIIVDTTSSMNNVDSEPSCSGTRISCALAGIQQLLKAIPPCSGSLSSCGPASTGTLTAGANVANPVDEVSLMAFPGLTAQSEATKDYICPTSSPSTTSYNNSPSYMIVPFSSDYRTSVKTTVLNTSSSVVIAAGSGGCSGLRAPGGQGTFYAGVIDAAQAQLVANSRPNTKNVMILLSDGDANASASQMSNKTSPYPKAQQCHQAINRAKAAAATGTIIYSVAYGSPSSGCSTDTSPTITPCQTMQQIASSPQNFFSDYAATGGTNSCVSAARPASTLNQIFNDIAGDLTVARLIPNNAL